MRETRGDTTWALAVAIGLHALIVLVVLATMWWPRPHASAAAGAPVDAALVDADSLSAAARRALQATPKPPVEPEPEPVPEPVEDDATPLPQPVPEPVPEEVIETPQPTPQDFIPEPDDETREEVVDTPTPRASDATEVQAAKRRQEQVDLTEAKRQQDAQAQQKKTALQAERERQLAEIRRQRAAATREASLAEQKLQQIADARARQGSDAAAAAARPGAGGTDASLQAAYAEAIRKAIVAKWTRPENIPLGARCKIVIRQLPGGEVTEASVGAPCSYDEAGRQSIERAVMLAQPLPYAGFESVFQRTLNLNFEAADR